MKERPILFSGPMVCAILRGRKTQTRRIIKPQPMMRGDDDCVITYKGQRHSGPPKYLIGEILPRYGCPYGRQNDGLWVRETFKPVVSGEVKNRTGDLRYGFGYNADNAVRWNEFTTRIHDLTNAPRDSGLLQFQERPWKPASHMPRNACRLHLQITEIRTERLQDMSDADAIAEGCGLSKAGLYCGAPHKAHGAPIQWNTPNEAYASVWKSINGPDSWDSNPWVWVISFRRIEEDAKAAKVA
jgi:hypothetical protein